MSEIRAAAAPRTPDAPENPHIPPQNAPNHPAPTNAIPNRRQGRPPSTTLSARQRYALTALLAGHTDAAVTRALRINRKTLYTWKRHPLFRAAYDASASDARQAVADRLTSALLRSTNTFRRHLKSDNPVVALRAARTLLASPFMRHLASRDDDPRPS